jgi:5'-nucleotidase
MENKFNFQEQFGKLLENHGNNLHVVADFDGTLTKEFVGGVRTPSIISVLRDTPGYLSSAYQNEAKALYEKYHGFERDASLSLEERKNKMKEWWMMHYKLLITSGLKCADIESVATSGIIEFREGAKDFLLATEKLNIPVIIFSASGLGEAIPLYCKHEGIVGKNIHYIINRFSWNEKGEAVAYSEPIIHSLNKDETMIAQFPEIQSTIKDRNNVLLLGNSVHDAGMLQGGVVDKKITVGFLDEEDANKADEFKEVFDYICSDYLEINQALQ